MYKGGAGTINFHIDKNFSLSNFDPLDQVPTRKET